MGELCPASHGNPDLQGGNITLHENITSSWYLGICLLRLNTDSVLTPQPGRFNWDAKGQGLHGTFDSYRRSLTKKGHWVLFFVLVMEEHAEPRAGLVVCTVQTPSVFFFGPLLFEEVFQSIIAGTQEARSRSNIASC